MKGENKHTSTLDGLGDCWRRKLRTGQLAVDHVENHRIEEGHSCFLCRVFRTTADAVGIPVDRSLGLAAHSLEGGRIAGLVEDNLGRPEEVKSSWSPGIDCMGPT